MIRNVNFFLLFLSFFQREYNEKREGGIQIVWQFKALGIFGSISRADNCKLFLLV